MSRPSPPAAIAAAVGVTAAVVQRFEKRRCRRATGVLRNEHAEALARIPSPEQVAVDTLVAELLARRPVPSRAIETVITDHVHARLHDGDVAAVEARLEGKIAELYATCDDATRKRIALNFAAAYHLGPVIDRAGMSNLMPPEDVHAMARGPVAAGGDFYLADLIFHALQLAGLDTPEGAAVLDFGSSSGRVLRAVAAGRSDVECIGCDPNEGAIVWASRHLPMARFFVSPQRPPLDLATESLDLVYAVSIWSHFAEAPAIAWLDEMHRLLRPDGVLVLTTHGLDTLATQLRRGDISGGTASDAARTMLRGGHHFVDVFGPDGDWGVKDVEWGNAYFTLEWLIERTSGAWDVKLDWLGGLDQVQDVIVLQRKARS